MFAFVDAAAAPAVITTETAAGPVVVVADARAPLAWLRLAYPVGRSHDLPGRQDPELLWRAAVHVARAGTEIDADVRPWMSADATGVDVLFLVTDLDEVARDLRLLLETPYDRVYVPRTVVRAGWRETRGVPDAVLDRAIAATFHAPDDPRRTSRPRGPIVGPVLADLRNAVVSTPGAAFGIAGAVDPDEGAELVRRLLDAAPEATGRPPSALRPLIAADALPVEVVLRADGLDEVLLAWARPGLAAVDPDAPAALVADEALRVGIERLARTERGDAYGVSTRGIVEPAPGVWQVRTGTSVTRAAALVRAIDDWLASVAAGGLPADVLAQAQAVLEARVHARTAGPFDVLADEVGHRLATDGPRPDALLEAALGAPDDGVDRVARALAGPDGFVRFRVLPRDADDPLEE